VYAFVEVVPGLAVVADHVLGDLGPQEVADVVQEVLVRVREFDA
jgi:hypothetical protein